MNIQGAPAPGTSSGEAMKTMEELAGKLPKGIGYAWTGLSYEERQAGSQAPALYAISIAIVFLCLAALYESWSIPIAVILVVPLGILGAVLATHLRGLTNDVYFQVGLLLTIGLSAKNAILIVEFAKKLHEKGKSVFDAAIEACHIRLRPILMTSLAFMFGVLPLALASGAGSGAENAIGNGRRRRHAVGHDPDPVLRPPLLHADFPAVQKGKEGRATKGRHRPKRRSAPP